MRRLLALSRLHSSFERRVHSREDQYVRLNAGWFSDRSASYLAAGRPVIIQETGFTKNYGGKAGLLSFGSLGEIVDAVNTINAITQNISCRRALAREVFEAEKSPQITS